MPRIFSRRENDGREMPVRFAHRLLEGRQKIDGGRMREAAGVGTDFGWHT